MAPEFTLEDTRGNQVKLADHKGRRILRFDDVTVDTPAKLDSKRFD